MTAATTKVLSTMSGMASNRSLMDENSKTLDAATAASMKVYAPSSDRRLVLAAIDNQVNASKVAWRESNSDGQSNAAREKFFLNCIDQTGAFIKRQVELLTMSMDEAAVEDVLDSFRTRRLANTRSSSPLMADDENCDDDSLSSDDDENEEFEYDDQKHLIENIIKSDVINKELTIDELLGKSKRLIVKTKISEFESKFISEIKEGKIDYITLIEVDQIVKFKIEKIPEKTFDW